MTEDFEDFDELARQVASQYAGVDASRVGDLLTKRNGKGVMLSKMEDRAKRPMAKKVKAPKTRRAQPEHVEQSLLFQWCERMSGAMPELALAYAIPNGGHRHIAVAKKLKAEGVKSGVPDVCLPVARGSYHSLYVEMKAGPTSSVSDAQAAWHAELRAQGHAVRVAYGWESARDAMLAYLAARIV